MQSMHGPIWTVMGPLNGPVRPIGSANWAVRWGPAWCSSGDQGHHRCPRYATGLGSATLGGNVPTTSARVVENLLEAGAVIMGKTTTCELAYMTPTTQRTHIMRIYPWRILGGSAAAVAARHVPIAIGSQTVGRLFALHLIAVHMGLNPLVGLPLVLGFSNLCDIGSGGCVHQRSTDAASL